jgi:hypothetical protein
MSTPGFVESLAILFRANRGYRLVTIANFGDGVAYFGFLALISPVALLLARRWLISGVSALRADPETS